MTEVLDHGEVILVDSMADDSKVVMAARISTGKEDAAVDEKKDEKLIKYLMSNGHGTPFEHAVFQFLIKCPIFVAREWQRHRIASYNEFSMRYSEVKNDQEFYIPGHVREQDPQNKQGSFVSPNQAKTAAFMLGMEHQSKLAYKLYQDMLTHGVAREMARMVLPVNVYTRFWFTVNARSLMNFLMLRNAPGAQWEIQQFAIALEDIFAEAMPTTHRAFVANGRRAP